MIDSVFFVLGLLNSLLLIAIFLLRRRRLDLVKRFGWLYLLLAIPAGVGIILAAQMAEAVRYLVFLIIYLVFLGFEGLLDFVLKIDFRTDFKAHWVWLVPYLCLYYASNYGFVMMPWKHDLAWGIVMAALFAVQFAANLTSHPKAKGA